MTKFASVKKNSSQKLSSWKEIWNWTIWNFSYIQQKHALTCPGLYRPIFPSLCHTSLISPRREINETVDFRNFRTLFPNMLSMSLWHFGTLFLNGKNKTKWHGTSSMLQWSSPVHCGSYLANVARYKKMVKKMLYF